MTSILQTPKPQSSNQPEYESITVPREVLLAFKHFMLGDKLNGSLTVNFKSGGIAGVETNTRQILK